MALGNITQKVVVSDDKVHGGVFAGAYGILVALLTLPFALISDKLMVQMFSPSVILVLLLMSVLYAFAMWGFFTAMKHVPISEITLLESTTPLWVLFGSVLFLGESLTWNKFIGVLFLIAGLFVTFRYKGVKRWSGYHTLGLVSGALYAGAYMTDKYLLDYLPTLSYQVLSFGLPSILILGYFYKRAKELKYFFVDKRARNIVLSSAFVGGGYYTLFKAYQLSGEISLVNPIYETKSLWVVLMGIVFLKEKDFLRRKIIGMILAIIGVLLVS